jgi:REP element-mobilizing transposase RayT
MARKARFYQLEKSLIYHVINRGVICQTIFHGQEDVNKLLSLMKLYQKRFNFKIYHWCVMNNHYHLVVELRDSKKLSKIIGAIQQLYALYHHRRYQTTGRLFQSRFKSQAIEKVNYLLACARYVERNPVRAGLVKLPWEWPWSSAHYFVLGKEDGITQPNPEWNGDVNTYQKWLLLEEEAKEEEKIFRSSKEVIGSEEFLKKLTVIAGRFYLKGRGRPRK